MSIETKPDPDGERQGIPLPWVASSAGVSSRQVESPSQGVVGQDEAMATLRGLLTMHASGLEGNVALRPRPIALVGPIGCGKSTGTLEIAEDLGLVVGHVDMLVEGDRHAIRAAAVRSIRSAVGDDPKAGAGAVILVENVFEASESALEALARVLNEPGSWPYSVDGDRLVVDLASCLWVVCFTGVELKLDGMAPFLVSPNPIPRSLANTFQFVVFFRGLSRSDLFAILAISRHSPWEAACERLRGAGVDADLSEMAMWELVNQATQNYLEHGARGLVRAVADLECRIWSALANPEEEPTMEDSYEEI